MNVNKQINKAKQTIKTKKKQTKKNPATYNTNASKQINEAKQTIENKKKQKTKQKNKKIHNSCLTCKTKTIPACCFFSATLLKVFLITLARVFDAYELATLLYQNPCQNVNTLLNIGGRKRQ